MLVSVRRSASIALFVAMIGFCFSAVAQFSGSISGTVTDQSGAIVVGASVTITEDATNITKSAKTNSSGIYNFLSIAPGNYRVSAEMAGFARARIKAVLGTDQTLNIPIKLSVASSAQSVDVSTDAPLLDTADTRNQLTIEPETINSLPLAGRSVISLITLAPGVVGLGQTGGIGGSGLDNFSTETQVSASANGQGSMANMYIVDGLDVTSTARDGVTNLTPNPDSIREVSIQTNTYDVDYGRGSSIQMAMTTKSGTDQFHGIVSEFYTTQQLWARQEFTPVTGYAPFHTNNISATIGGPVLPSHHTFFFGGVEYLRSLLTTDSSIVIEDPAFTQWARQNYPNSFGTKLLTTYTPGNASNAKPLQTASQAFGSSSCGTPTTNNIPCSLTVFDSALFNASSYRHGLQYNFRIDQYFGKDRLYGSFYRTTLHTGGPTVRPAFSNTLPYGQYALQLNETHTFSASTLNEAVFSVSFVEGQGATSNTMSVPVVNVTGLGVNFGTGGPLYFSQKSYHWRDVLTKIIGKHDLKAGYEGWTGDYLQNWTKSYDHPTFAFNNILNLVQDIPYTETGLAYNPVTGAKSDFFWDASQLTHGFFAEDVWRPAPKVTVHYGLRWDDFGNPYASSPDTVLAPFYLGSSSDPNQRVANGHTTMTGHAMNHSMTNLFSPRGAIAYDFTGTGKWVLKAGAGLYRIWPGEGALQGGYQGTPPGAIKPTFFQGQTPGPVLTIGSSNQDPYGFVYPTLPARTLDSKGGIPGLTFTIGSVDPNLKSPLSYVYSATVEREIFKNIVSSIGYAGSHSIRILSGGGQQIAVQYGVDINSYPGDLIQNNMTLPTRLNTSFGQIIYAANDRESAYNALILAVRGRFLKGGFVSASYTRSSSMDDTQVYPTWQDPHHYYSHSVWDVPNRFSLVWNYQLPDVGGDKGLVGRVASGWALSGNTILQSGTPYTVGNGQPFVPIRDNTGKFIDIATTSGDYNADGDNNDYPDVISYQTSHKRQDFLNGLFTKAPSGRFAFGWANFPLPQFGQEGNEKYDAFRNPGYASSDISLLKNTTVRGEMGIQVRIDGFDIFNRPNLGGVNTAIPQPTFGKVTSQINSRYFQLGARLTF